jgi:signal peptidase I
VEAIAVAFMLAFVFKTFLAEAFIIPTGSMAPTLQGRHNDIYCEKCGYEYRTGALETEDNRSVECPNCRHMLALDLPDNLYHQTYPGDKILVNKFIYDFTEPQRFDVIVFKFPEDSKTNYIKRLIGLPGETIKIINGDVYVSEGQDKPFKIAQKPDATKLQAMLIDVFDNDFLNQDFIKSGWPLRWTDWSDPNSSGNVSARWQPKKDDNTSYEVETAPQEIAWIRYRHFNPTENDWAAYERKKSNEKEEKALASQERKKVFETPAPSVITDLYAYNLRNRASFRGNYVGDLAIEFKLENTSADGSATFELVRGGQQFQAIADLKTGKVELKIPALPSFKATSTSTPLIGGKNHKILFANVDRKLWLVVDGAEIAFGASTAYDLAGIDNEVVPIVQPGSSVVSDLSPVGIGVKGSAATVSHLRIMRDVYYTSIDDKNSAFINKSHSEAHLLKDEKEPLKDQFFMCGDNSPNSLDSRLWPQQFFVERRNLIGKATYVFWPHSWPTGISKKFDVGLFSIDLPFWPNFSRMRLIR